MENHLLLIKERRGFLGPSTSELWLLLLLLAQCVVRYKKRRGFPVASVWPVLP